MDKAQENRARYTLLMDRRRALLELEKLVVSINNHAAWRNVQRDNPAAATLIKRSLGVVSKKLCKDASQAPNDILLKDVRYVYSALVGLSRIWVSLERDGSVSPVLLDDLSRYG